MIHIFSDQRVNNIHNQQKLTTDFIHIIWTPGHILLTAV